MSMLNKFFILNATLSETPLLSRLFFASVEMAVLAGVVWGAVRLFRLRSPRLVSFLWLLVLAKPLVALAVGALLPVFQVAPVVLEHMPVVIQDDAATPKFTESARSVSREPIGAPKSSPAPIPENTGFPWPWSLAETLTYCWLGGVVLAGAYACADRLKLHRMLARASQAPPEVTSRYAAIADALHLKKRPRLLVTGDLESPALAGVIAPTVLLPAWMVEQEASTDVDWALRHELMHHKLRDTFANGIRQLTHALFFFHPVTWWGGRKWEEAAEQACDRALVATESDVNAYAENLYMMLAQIHGRRQQVVMTGLFATRTQIGRRIAALLANPLQFPAKLGAISAACLIVLAGATLAVGATFGAETPTSAVAVSDEARAAVDDAIERLSTTNEAQADRIVTIFDTVRSQPNQQALAVLCEYLESDVATKRRSAIYILQMLPWDDPAPAFAPLRTLLKHSESITRGMASMSLATLGDMESHDAMADMLATDKDPYARRCAAWALGELNNAESVPLLKRARRDKNAAVKANAQNALERIAYLKAYADATGDKAKVARAFWVIGGSVATQTTRLDGAVAVFEAAEQSVVRAVYDTAVAGASQTFENVAKYVSMRLGFDSKSPGEISTSSASKAQAGDGEASAPDRLAASCMNNLKQLGLVCVMFAAEARGGNFPLLDPRPGRLAPLKEDLYPEFMAEPRILMCPTDAERTQKAKNAEGAPDWIFDDQSYWYLGYALSNEAQGLEYINAYRKQAASGKGFEKDLKNEQGKQPIRRLRNGVERFLITDLNDPKGNPCDRIPVMIERPGHHKGGSAVLFLDGHVELIPYPGKFPMTERFITALQSLDEL